MTILVFVAAGSELGVTFDFSVNNDYWYFLIVQHPFNDSILKAGFVPSTYIIILITELRNCHR